MDDDKIKRFEDIKLGTILIWNDFKQHFSFS